jgi:hypothetical protein
MLVVYLDVTGSPCKGDIGCMVEEYRGAERI